MTCFSSSNGLLEASVKGCQGFGLCMLTFGGLCGLEAVAQHVSVLKGGRLARVFAGFAAILRCLQASSIPYSSTT